MLVPILLQSLPAGRHLIALSKMTDFIIGKHTVGKDGFMQQAGQARMKMQSTFRQFLCGGVAAITAITVIAFSQSVQAQDYTVLPPPLQPPPPTAAPPAPPPAPMQPMVQAPTPIPQPFHPPGIKTQEQLQVEAAMGGRDMTRDYQRYAAMFPPGPGPHIGFAEYLYRGYEARRRSGIMLAGVTAPILAGMTIMGSMLLYRHGVNDGGGFCSWSDNSRYYDGYYYNDYCDEDDGEIIGIIMISTFGSIAVIATLIPGIVKTARYNKRMRRIEPLVPMSTVKPQFSWGVGPGSVSAKLVF